MTEKELNLQNFKMLMAGEVELTPVEQKVVVVHSLNRQNGLICLDRDDKECEYPIDWRQKTEGSYKFLYKNNKTSKTIKFTLTTTPTQVIVIFGEETTSTYRVQIDLAQSEQETVRKYELTLKQYLNGEEKYRQEIPEIRQKQTLNIPENRGTGYSSVSEFGSYPPKNLVNPPEYINNPFGQEEYVGPNSALFRNPNSNPQYPQGSLRIPPGARYDPIDPFDNPLMQRNNKPKDFFGFDEFGRPKPSPFGGRSGSSRSPFGDFGGGFGGGFDGGFGGGFGGPMI